MTLAPPKSALRIVALLNSAASIEDDALRDAILFSSFCKEVAIDPPKRVADEVLLASLRELRGVLRACFLDPASPRARRLQSITTRARLMIGLDGEGLPVLQSAASGSNTVFAQFVLDSVSVAAGGGWRRIRFCDATGCDTAFFDTTRSRTRRWCDMKTCGNRAKVAQYRERKLRGEVKNARSLG